MFLNFQNSKTSKININHWNVLQIYFFFVKKLKKDHNGQTANSKTATPEKRTAQFNFLIRGSGKSKGKDSNKLASLEATLVRNYDPLNYWHG